METPEPLPVEPDEIGGEPKFCEHCGKKLIRSREPLNRPVRYDRYNGHKIIRYLACYTCPDWISETTNVVLPMVDLNRHSRFVFYKSRSERIWEKV